MSKQKLIHATQAILPPLDEFLPRLLQIVCLPIHPALRDDDQARIIDQVRRGGD